MSVDESTVIFGPIDQVGWASASATVTSPSCSAGQPRNGPPDAVSSRRATSVVPCTAARHWCSGAVLGVDRDDLGTRRAARLLHDGRAGDQRLLVGQRQPLARLERGHGHRQPGEADDRVEHDVGACRAASTMPSSPTMHLGAGRHAGRAPRRSASGRRSRRARAGTRRPGPGGRRPSAAPPARGRGSASGSRADDVERLGADGARWSPSG